MKFKIKICRNCSLVFQPSGRETFCSKKCKTINQRSVWRRATAKAREKRGRCTAFGFCLICGNGFKASGKGAIYKRTCSELCSGLLEKKRAIRGEFKYVNGIKITDELMEIKYLVRQLNLEVKKAK